MSRGQYGNYQQLVCLYLTACQALLTRGKAQSQRFSKRRLDFKVPEKYKENNLEMHETLTYRSTPSTQFTTPPSVVKGSMEKRKKRKTPISVLMPAA